MNYKVNYNRFSAGMLLDDLRKINEKTNRRLTQHLYSSLGGKYSPTTICNRFGGWNKALEKAGIEKSVEQKISKESLLENLETVWTSLNRQPKSKEMKSPLSKYSTSPYRKQFGSFQKALEEFTNKANSPLRTVSNRRFSDLDLLTDLKEVAKANKEKITLKKYNQKGIYNSDTFIKRFGTWNKALAKAEISERISRNPSREVLFENLKKVWDYLGRNPRGREMSKDPSKWAQDAYIHFFGSWKNTLKKFELWILEIKDEVNSDLPVLSPKNTISHVYLIKGNEFYKIGKTDDLGRRLRELQTQGEYEQTYKHIILTEDPYGIETYWHKRFKDKRRKNGGKYTDWFDLNDEEVKIFMSKTNM